MLTCITCSKQRKEDDAPNSNSSTKDAVKSLTAQIKDMALKVSGSYKGRPDHTDKNFIRNQRAYPEIGTISEGVPYPHVQPGISNSTPSWDFTSTGHPAARPDSRLGAFGGEVVLEHEVDTKEWMAQVEPGVHITFVSLPRGGNDLKRIRFSRDMFNKWEAQTWWGENYDRIMELYNVHRFNQQALTTPGRSEDGRESTYSRIGESPRMTPRYKPIGIKDCFPSDSPQGRNGHYKTGSSVHPTMEASRTTTSSRDEVSVSISNASDVESEWIEEDEHGVFITIRQLVDGTRELRRVRFSRERFGEVHAKLWWETNRDRIQNQYLC